ncbi:MAG: hypothetical protein A2Y77_08545 [Planctomycetes bacterium RBG_13_62_9]|nr:MAG: hypothetical protein A2Y77_08545 [Planctomycetes bacterium RBG_13_62_9]
MQHIDSILQRCDIDDAPLAQYVDPDLLDAGTDRPHRFPVARLKSMLDGTQFKAGSATSLIGKAPEIVQAGSNKSQWLCHHMHII